MTEKDKYAPQNKYRKENMQQVKIEVNKKTESEVLEWLNRQKNKSGAIKALIKAEIEREKNEA